MNEKETNIKALKSVIEQIKNLTIDIALSSIKCIFQLFRQIFQSSVNIYSISSLQFRLLFNVF